MYPVDNAMPAGKSGAKILVLGPAWVGDMVLAQSLFKTLKINDPHCTIDVAAPAWTLPLLERMPEVDKAIPLSFKHGQLALRQRWDFGTSLKTSAYTQSIILTNSLKSAVLPFAARIPIRTGFLGEFRYGLLNDVRKLDKTKLPRTVDRFVALGIYPGSPLPDDMPEPRLLADEDNARALVERFGLSTGQKILALCPGAEYGEAKRWPTEYYAEVAAAAIEHGWAVWLFGSDKDIPVTADINRLTQNNCQDFGGKTKLGEAVDLMSLCDVVVSNDSGLMHISAALGKKLIAIYGSSDPYHTPPMNADAVVEYLGLDCSPCFKRVCPLGHLNCLRKITPSQVSSRFLID